MIFSVTSRLQDLETSYHEETANLSHSLQFMSLRLLSPNTKLNTSGRRDESISRIADVSREQGKATIPSDRKAGLPVHPQPLQVTPARRIRRPVAIRRPKLTGKSVEGAAIHAVAASRKRASSNQFKNVASSAPVRRTSSTTVAREPSKPTVIQDPGAKRLGRPPPARRSVKEKRPKDEKMVKVRADFATTSRFKA